MTIITERSTHAPSVKRHSACHTRESPRCGRIPGYRKYIIPF